MKNIFSLILLCLCSIAIGQTPIKISTHNYKFLEGPAWDGTEYIYFSDLNDFKVYKYSTIDNTFELAFTMNTKPNGLMFDSNKDLVICEFSAGKISKRTTSGTFIEYLSEGYNGTRFDNVNDLCVDAKGGVYFTDPSGSNSPYQPARRVYYITHDGILTIVDDGTGYLYPNGILISNDGQHLFVNDSQSYNIYKYDIDSQTGHLSNKHVFATLTNNNDGDGLSRADGMALDSDENLYVSSKATIQVFNKQGTQTGTINFPTKTTNMVFGGSDKKTLYVTGWNEVYKVTIFDEASDSFGFHHPFDLPASADLSVKSLLKNNVMNHFFPNPTSNYKTNINIGNSQIENISIYNNLGKYLMPKKHSIKGNILELELNPTIDKGVYIVSLKTKQGNFINRNIIIN